MIGKTVIKEEPVFQRSLFTLEKSKLFAGLQILEIQIYMCLIFNGFLILNLSLKGR